VAASGGYDLPSFEKLTDFKTWAEEGPPKGTLYHYPNPHNHQILSVTASPAPPKIAHQIYVQGVQTKMVARMLKGEKMESVLAWAETEVIPGHEFVGTVVQLDDVAASRWGIAVGDRIVAEQIVPCWKCRYCLNGEYWMCAPHDMFGFKRRTPGGMAEYMVYNKDALVYKISSELPPAHAAFTEPLSCALHGVERGNIKFDDVVVVAGCGPIGLGMIAGSKSKNPKSVVALDMAQDKLELAKECGADVIINIGSEDVVANIKDMTGGYGADVYLEGTGHPSAVAQGLNLLRKLGTYVEYSVFGSDVSVDWSIISDDKELDVRGAHLGPGCWPAAIRMLEAGRLPMEKICTHQLPLADFQKGLDLVASGKESIKVSLIP
jgi:threonine dehydrogenase-like Zn-dependent dehydrogenase